MVGRSLLFAYNKSNSPLKRGAPIMKMRRTDVGACLVNLAPIYEPIIDPDTTLANKMGSRCPLWLYPIEANRAVGRMMNMVVPAAFLRVLRKRTNKAT